MAVTHAVLPQFREREAGVVVNVTSSVTSRPLPLLSIYTASKAAINAFTESLALELEQFNVRVRLVIPGSSPETAFRHTARLRMQRAAPTEQYADFAQAIFARIGQQSLFTTSRDVAEAIWYATTDPASPTRIPAGADAVALSA
jgi:short-subunit dehydrogenase